MTETSKLIVAFTILACSLAVFAKSFSNVLINLC